MCVGWRWGWGAAGFAAGMQAFQAGEPERQWGQKELGRLTGPRSRAGQREAWRSGEEGRAEGRWKKRNPKRSQLGGPPKSPSPGPSEGKCNTGGCGQREMTNDDFTQERLFQEMTRSGGWLLRVKWGGGKRSQAVRKAVGKSEALQDHDSTWVPSGEINTQSHIMHYFHPPLKILKYFGINK